MNQAPSGLGPYGLRSFPRRVSRAVARLSPRLPRQVDSSAPREDAMVQTAVNDFAWGKARPLWFVPRKGMYLIFFYMPYLASSNWGKPLTEDALIRACPR